MKTLILAAGAAALAMTAVSAQARPRQHPSDEPGQPLPYSQLDAYLKASPKEWANRDWWSEARTGEASNTAATSPAIPGDTHAPAARPKMPSTEAKPPSESEAMAPGEDKGAKPPMGEMGKPDEPH